mmetsp:Transcript_24157/g.61164  ORF Transcript_24157/g.61164 Transcript_24157/m.61164 type:complete len:80 (+) Transcript_24157:149-388(+)
MTHDPTTHDPTDQPFEKYFCASFHFPFLPFVLRSAPGVERQASSFYFKPLSPCLPILPQNSNTQLSLFTLRTNFTASSI